MHLLCSPCIDTNDTRNDITSTTTTTTTTPSTSDIIDIPVPSNFNINNNTNTSNNNNNNNNQNHNKYKHSTSSNSSSSSSILNNDRIKYFEPSENRLNHHYHPINNTSTLAPPPSSSSSSSSSSDSLSFNNSSRIQKQHKQQKQHHYGHHYDHENHRFITLPDDILYQVLLYLPTLVIIDPLPQVCRRLRGVCSRPLIWERLIDRDLRVLPWVLARDDASSGGGAAAGAAGATGGGSSRNDGGGSFSTDLFHHHHQINNNSNNDSNNSNSNHNKNRSPPRKRALTRAIGGCWARRQYIKAMLKEHPFRVLPAIADAPHPVSVDVALVGDCSGKTTLIHTFIHEEFPQENFSSTIVCEPFSVERELENGLRVMFRIWDTPSEEGYRFYRRHMYDNADIAVFLFCFCPDTAPSLFNLREWKQEVCNRVSNPDIVVCSIARDIDQCPFDPHVIRGALDHSVQPLHLSHCVPSRMLGIHNVFEQCARAVLYPQSFPLRQRSAPKRNHRRIPLPRI